jgi:hypothetical protein
MEKVKDQYGSAYALQPSIFRQFICWVMTSSSNSLSTFGSAISSAGTVSHPASSETLGWRAKITSAATALATAGTNFANNLFRLRGTQVGSNGAFFSARVMFEDADYSGNGTTTGARIFVGFANANLSGYVTQDDPGVSHVGFHRLSTDANFMISSEGGAGSWFRVDTGIPFVVNHIYDFYLYTPRYGGADNDKFYWRVDDITAGTTAEGVRQHAVGGTTMPTAGVSLRSGVQIGTIDAVARSISMQHVYTEADQ